MASDTSTGGLSQYPILHSSLLIKGSNYSLTTRRPVVLASELRMSITKWPETYCCFTYTDHNDPPILTVFCGFHWWYYCLPQAFETSKGIAPKINTDKYWWSTRNQFDYTPSNGFHEKLSYLCLMFWASTIEGKSIQESSSKASIQSMFRVSSCMALLNAPYILYWNFTSLKLGERSIFVTASSLH